MTSFYLALMYQKGYGTPKDKEQEKFYHQQFQETIIPAHLEKKADDLIKKFNYKTPE